MKKMVCLAIVLLTAGMAWAQPPDTISYQGFLTDSSGTPVDSSVNMTVGFYDANTGGTNLYTENHNGVTVSNGQFNLLLGTGSPVSGTWAGVDFTQPLWIEVTAGGETLSPRIPMSSVAYARYAFTVADASVSASSLKGSPGDGTAGQVLSSNGSGGFSWITPGDDMGNHVATQPIQLKKYSSEPYECDETHMGEIIVTDSDVCVCIASYGIWLSVVGGSYCSYEPPAR